MVTRVVGFTRAEVVSGSRYDCMLCHAPQAEGIAPLVDNSFQPVEPRDKQKDILKKLNASGKF